MNTSTYCSFRIIDGKVEKPIKVIKKDAKIPIKKVLVDAYFQKMRQLINDRQEYERKAKYLAIVEAKKMIE